MRKICALGLVLVLLLGVVPGLAGGEYHLAGYAGESVGQNWSTNLFFQRWAEKFDLSFNFSQFDSYSDWQKEIQLYLNGATLPDALFKAELSVQDTQALYESGLIIDLTPYIEADMPNLAALLKENSQWEKAITLKDGAIAALPGLTQMQTNNAMWINTQWLQNVKMEVPTDKASFEAVLKAFKTQDPNKNGKDDEIPLTFLGTWDIKFLAHAFGIIANDYNIYVNEAGQVCYLAYAENVRDFVAWVRDLYTQGLIDKNGFTTTDSLRQITDEKAAVTYGIIMGSSPVNLLPKADTTVYDIMNPLIYNNTQVYRDLTGNVTRGTLCITKSCKDPHALLKAVDYLYTDEGAMLAQVGIEGVEYTVEENGKWALKVDENTDLNTTMREATITDGGSLSYFVSAKSMLNFSDEKTVKNFEQLNSFNQLCQMPYPLVVLDQATQTRVDGLQKTLGRLLDMHLGRFILGQVELNDENWNALLLQLNENGLDEFMAIWQKAYDER